jgi:hypothetical protein
MSSIPQKNVGFPGNRINGPDEQLKTDLAYPLPRHGNPVNHSRNFVQEISCYYAISNAILGIELNTPKEAKKKILHIYRILSDLEFTKMFD